MKYIYFLSVLLFLVNCTGDDANVHNGVTNATITDFDTRECYCCSFVTIETAEGIYLVEEFPDVPLDEGQLPLGILVELNEYTGECPNKDASATYLN